jgi:hypothetical protein
LADLGINATDIAKMPGGLEALMSGENVAAQLLNAGGGTAAGALEAMNLMKSHTAVGAGTWADLGTGPASQTASSKISSFMGSAPGMGIVAGLVTGLVTGDWKTGAKVGIGTAAGAKLGSLAGPVGALIGGALGGLLGGKIGPKPSNKTSTWTVDLTSGKLTDSSFTGKKTPNAEQTKMTKGMVTNLNRMASTIRGVFPEVQITGKIGVEVGQRDGIAVIVNGKRQRFGYGEANSEKWMDAISKAFTNSIVGMDAKTKELISKVDYSNPELAKQQLQYIRSISGM